MIRAKVADAIRLVQRQICWKPGSAIRHLRKRKKRGHLTIDAELAEYEQIIRSVIFESICHRVFVCVRQCCLCFSCR